MPVFIGVPRLFNADKIRNSTKQNPKNKKRKMKNLGDTSVRVPNRVKRGVYPVQNDHTKQREKVTL